MSQRLGSHHVAGMPAGLTLQVSAPAPDVCLVHVGGELDMITAPHLTELINAELDARDAERYLVLDLDGLFFMGSSGLAALLAASRQAGKRGVALRLVCRSTAVLRPMKVTGLTAELSIHATLADALAQS